MSEDEYPTLAASGEEATPKKLRPFIMPPIESSPVVPLGYDDKYVIFALPQGEIRREPASRIAGMLKTDIYCCQAGQAFLTFWLSEDEETPKFMAQTCAVWFNRQCRDAGKWDSRRVERALGVWSGDTDEVVLHKGDEILRYVAGEAMRRVPIIEALRDRKGPIYKLYPPAPGPADPATAADGQWFRRALDMWRFEDLGGEGLTGADVVAGYCMAALLGGVPPFRVHVLIRALQGSGKTTLMTLIHKFLSALTGGLVNSFSDAGWRSDISGMARPVVVDEAESARGEGGPGPVEQILAYLRLMSTGEGFSRRMGGMDGATVTQTAVGAVIMAAINPPKLDSALASRVADFWLLPLNGSDLGPDDPRPKTYNDDQLKAARERAEVLAPAFLGRALEGAPRFLADMAEMKRAILDSGEEHRTADLVACLAAGRRLLMFDAPLTPREAEAEAVFWRPLLAQREESGTTSNPGADLLGHIMAFETGQHSHSRDRRLTVGDIIARWANNEDIDEGVRTLKTLGLRLYEWPGPRDGPYSPQPGPWLLVCNHHAGMEKITAKTEWGNWRATLKYLAGLGPDRAPISIKPLHYGPGPKHRGLAVPLAPWLEKPMTRVPMGVPSFVPWEGTEDAE